MQVHYDQQPELETASQLWRAADRDAHSKAASLGFTLIELLLVIAIIAILSSLALVVLQGAVEDARESRARSQLQRITTLLNQRFEQYETRILPIGSIPGMTREQYHERRNEIMARLVLLEMPFEIGHVQDPYLEGNPPLPEPSLHRRFREQRLAGSAVPPPPVPAADGPVLLHAVLRTLSDLDDRNALDFLRPNEIDVDLTANRARILDPWGVPLSFRIVDGQGAVLDMTSNRPLSEFRVQVVLDPSSPGYGREGLVEYSP